MNRHGTWEHERTPIHLSTSVCKQHPDCSFHVRWNLPAADLVSTLAISEIVSLILGQDGKITNCVCQSHCQRKGTTLRQSKKAARKTCSTRHRKPACSLKTVLQQAPLRMKNSSLILRHRLKELIILFSRLCVRRFKQLLLRVTAMFTRCRRRHFRRSSVPRSWIRS